jgi:hypothetical protein
MTSSLNPTVYNVELVNFLVGQGKPFLRATRVIKYNDTLVLRGQKGKLFKRLIMDRDVKCFNTANDAMKSHIKKVFGHSVNKRKR